MKTSRVDAGRIKFFLAAAVIFALAVLVRMAARSADPPGWLSWSAGIFSDEGIYSADARLWTLYGQHMQGNFHVSVIAPLYNLLLLRVFHHWGISLIKLRMVSIVASLLLLIAFTASLRVWYDRRTALIGLLLLSVSAPFVLYNRLGLMENVGALLLVLAYLTLGGAERSERRVGRLTALGIVGALCGLVVVWKATFLLGALALIVYALWRHRGEAVCALVGGALAFGIYGVVWYAPHHVELGIAGRYYLTHQYLPHSLGGLWFDLHRGLLTGESDGVLPYLARFAPCLTALTLAAALPAVRKRDDLAAWLWLALPLTAILFINYTPSRYFLIFWPALAVLAARTLASLPPRLAAVGIIAALAPNFVLLGLAWQHRTFTEHDDARILEKALPRDAWIAGQFAPTLCLDNSLRSMYIQKGLANTPAKDALENLPITHVLATRTTSSKDDPWQGAYSDLIAGPAGLYTLPVGRKFVVKLYASEDALP